MTETLETEEEATARILAWRTHRALQGAPDLTLHIRSIALNGQTERGETLPEWTAPMRITAADTIDELYVQLHQWCGYWAEQLGDMPPAITVAWTNQRGDGQGFRAGTSPEAAHGLVQLLAMWLNVRADRINAHDTAATYREDVCRFIGAARSQFPTAPRPEKDVSARPCPLCGEFEVSAEWSMPHVDIEGLTDDQAEQALEEQTLLAVEVSCHACGYEIDVPPSKLVGWLA